MRPRLALLALLAACAASASAQTQAPEETLDGYAEWRRGAELVVDGQRVRLAAGGKFKGQDGAEAMDDVPLGFEVKATGRRAADGSLAARQVEVQRNGQAMFEKKVWELTDEAEADYRRARRFFQKSSSGRVAVIGRLHESGPQVDRARFVLGRLLPPYLRPDDVRVYVIDNKDWNAFAMGNYSVYVFSGLMEAVDDDELAVVLGHELAHATHEHTRRQFKKAMWIQLAALGMTAASDSIESDKKRALAGVLAMFSLMAWKNGYGRDLEDQADRVGLRYAYEGGYDVRRGPELWKRFAKKYGERAQVVNFFLGDHSKASARAVNLQRELALNYPAGAREPRAPAFRAAEPASPPAASAASSTASGRSRDIARGMRTSEVRRLLGRPSRERRDEDLLEWTYPDCTVVFEKGRVAEVRF
jgi:hypothetical protein